MIMGKTSPGQVRSGQGNNALHLPAAIVSVPRLPQGQVSGASWHQSRMDPCWMALQILPKAKYVRLVEALNQDPVGDNWCYGVEGKDVSFLCPHNFARAWKSRRKQFFRRTI